MFKILPRGTSWVLNAISWCVQFLMFEGREYGG